MAAMKFPNGLAAAMESAKIGPTDLARRLNTSKQNVDRWAKGLRKLTPATAKQIAPHVGKTAAQLLLLDKSVSRITGGGATRVQRVPLISWVSAGKLSGGDVPANVRTERRLAVADLGEGEWIALRVQGDSMNLVAPEGSVIFVNLSDRRLVEEGFFVFGSEGGDSTFKRYRGGRRPRLQPYSSNPDHETIQATDELKVVGRVRRTMLDL